MQMQEMQANQPPEPTVTASGVYQDPVIGQAAKELDSIIPEMPTNIGGQNE